MRCCKTAAVLSITCLVASCHCCWGESRTPTYREEPRPQWPQHFAATFNETTQLLLWSWKTEGRMVYDASLPAERVDRASGRGDRYCMTVAPRSDTPCTHLVVGGQRYIVMPQLRRCCRCCSDADGCGVLAPGWLDTATYMGEVTLRGVSGRCWSVAGLQRNVYCSATSTSVPGQAPAPLELDQIPNDLMSFPPDGFDPVAPPPAAFDLPGDLDCSAACPVLSTCTLARVAGMARRAVGWRRAQAIARHVAGVGTAAARPAPSLHVRQRQGKTADAVLAPDVVASRRLEV